jgi:two-component system, NarL family, response regulator NreC
MTKESPTKILIADDHGIIREALRRFLEQSQEYEVVGEACTGQEVLQQCRVVDPDIVIMDISMPDMNGIDCTAALRQQNPRIRILTLTCHDDEAHLKQCLAAGTNAYVLKRSFSEDLRVALLAVERGGTYIDAAIAGCLGSLLKENNVADQVLSEREMQVVSLLAQGLSLKDVGKALKISLKTVETYKSRSFEKLNLKSRADLVKYALEHDLLKNAALPFNHEF